MGRDGRVVGPRRSGWRRPTTGQEIKLSDCPAAVRKTIQAEAKGARIETVHKEKEEDETVYWAEVVIGGKTYAIGVLEDGTLTEMNLAVDDAEVPFERCPAAVQATFRREAFGEKVEAVGKDMKYGVTIYETVVQHRGQGRTRSSSPRTGRSWRRSSSSRTRRSSWRSAPPPCRPPCASTPGAGPIGDITRSTGIGRPTFEAEVKIKDKVYLIEVAENGLLISKSLEAGEE